MSSLGNNQALVFHHFQDNSIFGMKLFALMRLVAAVASSCKKCASARGIGKCLWNMFVG
jgi:hypothetical protein